MAAQDPYHMYIYNLPYAERKKLCRILDFNNVWEELGGLYMKFDVASLQQVGMAKYRGNSPSDELLSMWGTQNHTVLQLFILLSKMQHYQAMMVLKSLVDPKYHRLIYEGEENFSQLLPKQNPGKEPQESDLGSNSTKPTVMKAENKQMEHDNNMDTTRKEWVQDKMAIKIPQMQNNETGGADGLSPSINYHELEVATSGWDDKCVLGRGGFGTVYKGSWKNTLVAIKRLQVQKGGDEVEMWKTHREQSLREMKYLNSCKHDNILALYGYSIGGPHDCLVYQYMPNGSLEDRLLCREGSKPLNWAQRHSIAIGTARGLQFLHTIGSKPLIHGDIKSANILLDTYLEPKIGDFGLAREGPLQQYTHVKVSRVHGTRPYLPDEFLRAKKFSTKVDTYSFGIVLFELATGLRAYDEYRKYKFLKDHVLSVDDSQTFEELRDTRAGPDDLHTAASLIRLGKLCISTKPRDRPEMVVVLHTLESANSDSEIQHCINRQNNLQLVLQNDGVPQSQNKRTNQPLKISISNSPDDNSGGQSPTRPFRTMQRSPVLPVIQPSCSAMPAVPIAEESPSIIIQPPSLENRMNSPEIEAELSGALPLISALGIKSDSEEISLPISSHS
ncbi:hypothetical protein O3M35_007698 [Rhynocoris fuscipes]|uniref:non-specific serine/threonine protein kinase n=1 Tax=Rhynocoris fuscipes TaxID=488301 RepID=A0AAW1DG15_9HEMI